MGLFSSKSSSSSNTTTNYNDNSRNTENVADFGALSHDNLSIGADSNFSYVEQGLVGENLDSLLGTVKNLNDSTNSTLNKMYDSTQSTLASTFDKMVGSVQNSAETAINTTAQAYAESDDELRRAIDGIRPIALYAALAAVAYFIFRSK